MLQQCRDAHAPDKELITYSVRGIPGRLRLKRFLEPVLPCKVTAGHRQGNAAQIADARISAVAALTGKQRLQLSHQLICRHPEADDRSEQFFRCHAVSQDKQNFRRGD